MILNTPPQAGAYRLYALSLLHMYLTEEGPSERVRRKGSVEEGPSEKVRWRRSTGEDPTEKTYRKRYIGEDGCRKRWLTSEPTMALIPCERIEENNIFLY